MHVCYVYDGSGQVDLRRRLWGAILDNQFRAGGSGLVACSKAAIVILILNVLQNAMAILY